MIHKSIPIFSLIAWSGTGKTTYLEKLIPYLNRLRLKAAIVKHDGHDFDVDYKGTDTSRFTEAGAAVSAILSSTHGAILYNRTMEPDAFMAQIHDVDLILTEGFKKENWPKILLYRGAHGGEPAADPNKCFAIITDVSLDTDTPQFDLNDPYQFSLHLYHELKKR